MSVAVREATAQDAAALAAVQTAALLARADAMEDESTGEVPSVVEEVARWRALLGGAGLGWTFAAEDDGDLVGLVTTAPTASGSAAVTLLCVLPERWMQGVGTALLEASLASLRERGVQEATARVARLDMAASGVLSDVGFEPAEAVDAGPIPEAIRGPFEVGLRLAL